MHRAHPIECTASQEVFPTPGATHPTMGIFYCSVLKRCGSRKCKKPEATGLMLESFHSTKIGGTGFELCQFTFVCRNFFAATDFLRKFLGCNVSKLVLKFKVPTSTTAKSSAPTTTSSAAPYRHWQHQPRVSLRRVPVSGSRRHWRLWRGRWLFQPDQEPLLSLAVGKVH
jgi:hypothetical protein